ncbi:MAG: hypothetical protein ABFC39_06330 [Proteiniphilum sp.]
MAQPGQLCPAVNKNADLEPPKRCFGPANDLKKHKNLQHVKDRQAVSNLFYF